MPTRTWAWHPRGGRDRASDTLRGPGSLATDRGRGGEAAVGQQVADAGVVADRVEGRVVAQAVALLVIQVAEAGLEGCDQQLGGAIGAGSGLGPAGGRPG